MLLILNVTNYSTVNQCNYYYFNNYTRIIYIMTCYVFELINLVNTVINY